MMKTSMSASHRTEQRPLHSGFGPTTTAAEVASGVNLAGKVAVVTGGSSGIGPETARALSAAGARVVVGARNTKKAEQLLSGVNDVDVWPLDLADPVSVDRFAQSFVDSG